jgi:hypothetical protein
MLLNNSSGIGYISIYVSVYSRNFQEILSFAWSTSTSVMYKVLDRAKAAIAPGSASTFTHQSGLMDMHDLGREQPLSWLGDPCDLLEISGAGEAD